MVDVAEVVDEDLRDHDMNMMVEHDYNVTVDDADVIILVVVESNVISHRAGWRREAVLRELSPGAHFANFAHFAKFAHFAHIAHWIVGDWHPYYPKIKTDACNLFQTLQNILQTWQGQRY